MPDHVHIVLGPGPRHDVIDFMREFKSLVASALWPLGCVGSPWQQSFWDHIVDSHDSVPEVVSYVLRNPVAAGIVDDWRDYPFSGSLVLDCEEMMAIEPRTSRMSAFELEWVLTWMRERGDVEQVEAEHARERRRMLVGD